MTWTTGAKIVDATLEEYSRWTPDSKAFISATKTSGMTLDDTVAQVEMRKPIGSGRAVCLDGNCIRGPAPLGWSACPAGEGAASSMAVVLSVPGVPAA
jgi:hypothetical protein